MSARVLVAGIGNVFFGDDGFGVEVARHLEPTILPEGVEVRDYGIRSVHLAYDLVDNAYDSLILIDVAPLGEAAGTLAVLDFTDERVATAADNLDAHSMTPQTVLAALHAIGGHIGRVLVVGCQPGAFDQGMGLSPPVAGALDDAVSLVRETAAAEVARQKAGSHA